MFNQHLSPHVTYLCPDSPCHTAWCVQARAVRCRQGGLAFSQLAGSLIQQPRYASLMCCKLMGTPGLLSGTFLLLQLHIAQAIHSRLPITSKIARVPGLLGTRLQSGQRSVHMGPVCAPPWLLLRTSTPHPVAARLAGSAQSPRLTRWGPEQGSSAASMSETPSATWQPWPAQMWALSWARIPCCAERRLLLAWLFGLCTKVGAWWTMLSIMWTDVLSMHGSLRSGQDHLADLEVTVLVSTAAGKLVGQRPAWLPMLSRLVL